MTTWTFMVNAAQEERICFAVTAVGLFAEAVLWRSSEWATAIALVLGWMMIYVPKVDAVWQAYCRICRSLKLSPVAIVCVSFGVLLASVFWVGMSTPADAFFFSNAETFLVNAIKKNVSASSSSGFDPTNIISLVFNLLRALLLLYLAVAAISILQKFQQQQEWQEAARLPFAVLATVVIVDGMSSLIIGDGSSGSSKS